MLKLVLSLSQNASKRAVDTNNSRVLLWNQIERTRTSSLRLSVMIFNGEE